MPILEVEHIEKSFENTEVLKDISFTLEKGQVLSIIGSSGSGKTTLLRCLNFLERADSGIIKVNDEVIFDSKSGVKLKDSAMRKNRLHFGLVFQSFNLFPQYTAIENVMLARQLLAKEQPDYKSNKKAILSEIRKEAEELLGQMGLADRMDNYPHQLSGGQCQRVAIARALALHPDILCFDEPTSALDPELTGEVLKVIKELADKDTTMIIVTHEMTFARDVADKIIFMDNGYIVEQGDPVQVIENPREERTIQFLSRKRLTIQTISYDKINQYRHVLFFKDIDGIKAHMRKHAKFLRPKFDTVLEIFDKEINGTGAGSWTKPMGGYFISFETNEGCAKEVVAKCKEAGVVLTGAGAPFPYGKDPKDSVIRIAPSYPTLDELKQAAELFTLCVKLVTVRKILSER